MPIEDPMAHASCTLNAEPTDISFPTITEPTREGIEPKAPTDKLAQTQESQVEIVPSMQTVPATFI
jgi:hypothetical protein